MNVLIACGGTSGHINPAIAIADEIRKRNPDANFLFIGTKTHLEADLVPRAGYNIKFIDITGISRSKNFAALKYNVNTVSKYFKSIRIVKKYIKDFSPDIAIGTGGYVSAPVMRSACSMNIPTVIHEQNAFPGFTTRLMASKVNKILLNFPLAKQLNVSSDKFCVVGNPVKHDFFEINRKEARKKLGISENETVILSCGGSLGAKKLNEAFCIMARESVKENLMTHYHSASRDYEYIMNQLSDIRDNDRLKIYKYIYNMPEVMAAADLVISRSGAGSLTELSALGQASILIPSPNVTENHQYYNAKMFSDAGAAILLEEKDLDGKRLYEIVKDLVFDSTMLLQMQRQAKSLSNKNTMDLIYKQISEVCPKAR